MHEGTFWAGSCTKRGVFVHEGTFWAGSCTKRGVFVHEGCFGGWPGRCCWAGCSVCRGNYSRDEGTYNLLGQNMEHPRHGIYIQNGKKILFR